MESLWKPILIFRKGAARKIKEKMPDICKFGDSRELYQVLINKFSGLRDKILDPFCETGEVLVAAGLESRQCIGLVESRYKNYVIANVGFTE